MSQRTEPEDAGPEVRSPRFRLLRAGIMSRDRRRTSVLVGLLLVLVVALGATGFQYDFWRSAWSQQTLFPNPNRQLPAACAANEFALAGYQRRGAAQFDLRKTTIPRKRIIGGGPPKDGIPALTEPKQVPAREATYLTPEDRVIGVVIGETARAYPLRILDYHEIVNDRIDELPIAVTYCPLCDSAVVFDRRTELGEREFGVSGLLFNSNVLMYDRGGRPESLWSQLKAEGVSGPAARVSLKALPLELTTWQDWQKRHPQTTVLTKETGHRRDYSRRLYARYFASPDLMFAVAPRNRRLPDKTPVLGVWTEEEARAYPVGEFASSSKELDQQLGGKAFVLEYDAAANNLRVAGADEGVQWMYSFWFAWAAFRPDTELYEPEVDRAR